MKYKIRLFCVIMLVVSFLATACVEDPDKASGKKDRNVNITVITPQKEETTKWTDLPEETSSEKSETKSKEKSETKKVTEASEEGYSETAQIVVPETTEETTVETTIETTTETTKKQTETTKKQKKSKETSKPAETSMPAETTKPETAPETNAAPETTVPPVVENVQPTETTVQETRENNSSSGSNYWGDYPYVANCNPSSMKFHRAGCSSIGQMKDSHKVGYNSAQAAIDDGYTPCKRCHPENDL